MNIEDKFLLDAVSVTRLGVGTLNSGFIQSSCLVPEEIFYEVGSQRKKEAIKKLVEKPNLEILKSAQALLTDLGTKNSILDLYQNEGNGDVILLAAAISKKQQEDGTLFQTDWIIVTDDRDLRELAKQKKIKTFTTKKFIKHINLEAVK